jgi:cytochrome c5
MRTAAVVFFLALVVTCYACGHINARSKAASPDTTSSGASNSLALSTRNLGAGAVGAETATARVDFATQIKPIFEARCQPCHFSGGKVYAKMPFDSPETIRNMGTKLFTRIKDENERRVIRDFLAQE